MRFLFPVAPKLGGFQWISEELDLYFVVLSIGLYSFVLNLFGLLSAEVHAWALSLSPAWCSWFPAKNAVGMPFAVILLFTICGCNIAVWRKLKQGSVSSQLQNRTSRNKRVTRTLLFVSTLALFCWLPFVISNGLRGLGVSIPWRHAMIVNFLNFSNSFVNPIVYALRIPEFRRVLAVCCSTKYWKLNKEDKETGNNKADPLIPLTQKRSSRPDSSPPQLKFNYVNTETKFMLTE